MFGGLIQISILLITVQDNQALFSWLFDGWKVGPGPEEKIVVPAPKGKVPFEMTTADEKFLAEAKFTQELSPLDLCHHMVISKLQSTCSDISEESLGKLSVQLLNCQSESEGRQTFSCTDDMTIKDCTKNMDPTIWNAYQIVSNRARAICYSTRQQQFRMKTESTVNKLMYTAETQVETMNKIKETQDDVTKATKQTLNNIAESHEELLSRQNALRSAQSDVHTQIVGNIRDLVREKAMIAAGNKELVEMTENIKKRLEDTTYKLESQEMQASVNHDELMADLAALRSHAQVVWNKLDASSAQMLKYKDEANSNYQETIKNLQKVNKTVSSVLSTIAKMQRGLENKLDWLTNFVGGTGDRVDLLASIIVHILYFFLVLISASFLHTPTFSRLVLLFLVPLNAWAEIKQKQALGFSTMISFILLTVLSNWVLEGLFYICSSCRSSATKAKPKATADHQDKGEVNPAPSDGMLLTARCMDSPSIFSPAADKSLSLSRSLNTSLNNPDIKRLTCVLEKLYQAGALLSPRKKINTDDHEKAITKTKLDYQYDEKAEETNGHVKNVEENKNEEPEDIGHDDEDKNEEDNDVQEEDKKEAEENFGLDPNEAAALTPVEPTIEQGSESAKVRVEQVKRRILNSPVLVSGRVESPHRTARRSSSPFPSQRRRSNTPSRATCESLTKYGLPCRLLQAEDSKFCYKHQ